MIAPALAKIKLDDDREIDLHAKVKVLLVDDDQRFLDIAQKYLEQDLGCVVDAVTETEEAIQYLQQGSYHVVITDLNFDPPQRTQGVQFIADNIDQMGEAKVVAITGQAYYAFQTRPELARLGVDVIEKGQDNFLEELTNITTDKAEEQRQEVADLLQAALSRIVPEVGVQVRTKGQVSIAEVKAGDTAPGFNKRPSAALEHLYSELESTLTRWLHSLPNTDEKVIMIGEQYVSVNELIQHIEKGTALGLMQMDALVKQFRKLLRLEDE